MTMTNAMSIDVEDYFQVSAFENHIFRSDWDQVEHRIEANMERLLDLMAKSEMKATFFVLGWLAERYPDMVKRIVKDGHELASHGYYHQRVRDLTQSEFRQDLLKSKAILEDISGTEIRGFRAPSYSIGKQNLWAFEVLVEAGYTYSSSIYPIKHDHYGFPGAPRFVFRDKKTGLIEIPITTIRMFRRLRPAGGGGFFRLYPYTLTKWLINQINQHEGQAAIFYLHPWEIDPYQPRQVDIPLKTRFRHYLNLDKTEYRLKWLLKDFNWGRVDQVFINDKEIPDYSLT